MIECKRIYLFMGERGTNMKCEFCSAKIADGVAVCPQCGKELTVAQKTAKPKRKSKGLKIGLSVTGLVLLAAILTGTVLHFTGVINVKKWFSEQDIFYKTSYSARLARVERRGDKVIAKLGNQELTNSELQVYYWTAVQQFLQYYGEDFAQYMGLNPTVPLDEQIYNETTGMTYQQFFLDQGLGIWSQVAILVQLAEDAGFQLPAAEQAQLEAFPETLKQEAQKAGFADVEAYVDKFFPGSSVEGYISYNANNLKAKCYYGVLYDSQTPTYEEMEAYYAQNEAYYKTNKIAKEDGLYHSIRQIYIPVVGDIGEVLGKPTYTQEEWDECLPKAQKVLDDYTEGGGGEEEFIQFVKEVSYTDYAVNDGLLTKLTKHTEIPTNLEESFAAAMKEWYLAEDRKPGDVGMVKDDEGEVQGYQILYYCSGTAIWEYETKNQMRSQRLDAIMRQGETGYPTEIKFGKILLGEKEATGATQPSQ